jgi:hypothetical protein
MVNSITVTQETSTETTNLHVHNRFHETPLMFPFFGYLNTAHNFKYDHYLSITILDINHCLVYYLKHNVSEIEFCLHLQVDPTHLCLRNAVF